MSDGGRRSAVRVPRLLDAAGQQLGIGGFAHYNFGFWALLASTRATPFNVPPVPSQ